MTLSGPTMGAPRSASGACMSRAGSRFAAIALTCVSEETRPVRSRGWSSPRGDKRVRWDDFVLDVYFAAGGRGHDARARARARARVWDRDRVLGRGGRTAAFRADACFCPGARSLDSVQAGVVCRGNRQRGRTRSGKRSLGLFWRCGRRLCGRGRGNFRRRRNGSLHVAGGWRQRNGTSLRLLRGRQVCSRLVGDRGSGWLREGGAGSVLLAASGAGSVSAPRRRSARAAREDHRRHQSLPVQRALRPAQAPVSLLWLRPLAPPRSPRPRPARARR